MDRRLLSFAMVSDWVGPAPNKVDDTDDEEEEEDPKVSASTTWWFPTAWMAPSMIMAWMVCASLAW